MKKLATFAFAAIASSSAAMATTLTVNCSPFPTQFTGSTGTSSVTCASFASQGISGVQSLDSVAVTLYADYTFGSTGSNDIRLSFNLAAPAGVTWANANPVIDVTGGFNSSGYSPSVPLLDNATSGVSLAAFANPFNITVNSSVISGGAATSSGGAQITYNYTLISSVPEPTGMALLGSGLVAIGLLGRRRVVRQ